MLGIAAGVGIFFALDMILAAVQGGRGGHGHSHHGGGGAKSKKKPATGKHLAPHSSNSNNSAPTAATTALLSLVADAAHNLMDGVVIGTAFVVSPMHGWRTSLAVLVHELPHELGDYAVLQQCGYTRTGIVVTQLTTGLTNAVGAGAVVLAASSAFAGAVHDWLTPFAAGAFLYLGLVSLLGDVRSGAPAAEGPAARCGYVVAFAVGVAALQATGWLEEVLGAHAHH